MIGQTILIVFCLLGSFNFIACKKELSPEERIREEFYQIKEYVEQKKIGKIMDFISTDYKDTYGNRRDSIKAILIQNIMFRKGIKIAIRDIEVKIDGDRAYVNLKIFMSESNGIIPQNADIMIIKCDMINSQDKWLITSARWEGHQSPF